MYSDFLLLKLSEYINRGGMIVFVFNIIITYIKIGPQILKLVHILYAYFILINNPKL
jgi:hypothetical protein